MLKQDFHINYGVSIKEFLEHFDYLTKYADKAETVIDVRRRNVEVGMFLTPATFNKLRDIMEEMEVRHKRDLGELKELKKDNKSLELKVRLLQNSNHQN